MSKVENKIGYKIIKNLFETIRLSGRIKLIVRAGTDKYGELFVIKCDEYEKFYIETRNSVVIRSAQEFIDKYLSEYVLISSIDIEDELKNKTNVFFTLARN